MRKNVVSILSLMLRCASDLLASARSQTIQHSLPIICESYFLSHLIPFALANIGIIAGSDPKVCHGFFIYLWIRRIYNFYIQSSVQILDLVKILLPHVSALSLDHITCAKKSGNPFLNQDTARETSSSHILVVESEHPYKLATVSQYR